MWNSFNDLVAILYQSTEGNNLNWHQLLNVYLNDYQIA
jgi:hypothetical protein